MFQELLKMILEYFFQIILLLHVILLPTYIYLTWNFNYWQKRGLRSALPLTILGSFPSILTRSRNLLYEIDVIYRYGDTRIQIAEFIHTYLFLFGLHPPIRRYKHRCRMVGIYFLRQPQIMVVDLRLAQEILDSNFSAFEMTAACSWMHLRNPNKLDKLALCSALWTTGEIWKCNRAVVSGALAQTRVSEWSEMPPIRKVSKVINFLCVWLFS